MCWHAYLLSPSAWYEDSETLHSAFKTIGGFPLDSMELLIDEITREYRPDKSQIDCWEKATGQSFDPPLATTLNSTREITCPQCSKLFLVPWITQTTATDSGDILGYGYSQSAFTATCPGCVLTINRGTLCANRVARDLALARVAITNGDKAFVRCVCHQITPRLCTDFGCAK